MLFRALFPLLLGIAAVAAEDPFSRPRVFSDGVLQVTVIARDDTPGSVHHALNRTWLDIGLKNLSPRPIQGHEHLLIAWTMTSRPFADAADGAGAIEEPAQSAPVPLTSWGRMMERALLRGHHAEPDLAPGETREYQFDLGRTYDATLTWRYDLAGEISYLQDGNEARLQLKRFQLN